MGFNQCYLRDVKDLESEVESDGLELFVKRYRKYDSLTGSSESFQFLEQKIKEYEDIKSINVNNNINNGM
jgi:predicted nucleotidyltransferase